MKNVYFVQANMTYGKAVYLPYATGCLASYAWSFEEIKSEYEVAGFIYRREPVDEVLERIINPEVVAFSCYTWTFEYNKVLAEKIKKRFPECKIIFGGHSVSPESDILSDLDFVDILIFGEGEKPFKEILDSLSGRTELSHIKNISFKYKGKIISTDREYLNIVDQYKSPYIEGYFDEIIAQNAGVEFCAVIETNRGCPYQCAYCDWCYTADLRVFPLDKVEKEIIWCSENKIEYIFCADGNFGILERDFEIAEFVAELKSKNGYPHIFNVCFAKNSNDTVWRISKLFYDNKLNKAATLAYQSVSKNVLEKINRKNFSMETFASIVSKYHKNHIPTYTEMILGLPGETYDSFCEGLCMLMNAGQQSALTVYYCQVYCNSLMGSRAYKEKYGIKTAHVPLNYLHSSIPLRDDIVEYTDLVVETNDMPFADMVRSIMFCTCLQCFHHIGLLKYFALYLNYESNVSYRSFYDSLLSYIFSVKDTSLNLLFERIKNECSDFTNGEWSYYNEKFGEIGWFLEEGAYMELISDIDTFWQDIMPFLKSFEIPAPIFLQLLSFQKAAIRLPGQERLSYEFEYDFIDYFDSLISDYHELKRRKIKINVEIQNPVYDWKTYAREVMLFAKRRGDTIVFNDRRYLNICYPDDE